MKVKVKYVAVVAGFYKTGRPKNSRVNAGSLAYIVRFKKRAYAGVWKPVEQVDREILRLATLPLVPCNRPAIVKKLNSYDAKALRDLDPKYYRDYYRFLKTLKP